MLSRFSRPSAPRLCLLLTALFLLAGCGGLFSDLDNISYQGPSSGDSETGGDDPEETLPAPAGFSASQGDDPDGVWLSWQAVPGADFYEIYRDRDWIYTTDTLTYLDTDAGVSPQQEIINFQASDGTLTDQIELNWDLDPPETVSPRHTYRVRAIHSLENQVSPYTAEETGYRAPRQIQSYDLIVTSADEDARTETLSIDRSPYSYTNTDIALAPSLVLGEFRASKGTSDQVVVLELEELRIEPDTVEFTLIPIFADSDFPTQASFATGYRGADFARIQWESTTSQLGTTFVPIGSTNIEEIPAELPFSSSFSLEYANAPEGFRIPRTYRAIITSDHTTPDILISNEDIGYREASCEPFTATQFNGGQGNLSDPYRICTPEALHHIGTDQHQGIYFILLDDLDLATLEHPSLGDPSQGFRGTFDGNFRTISNLTISQPRNNGGLFYKIGNQGVVKNLFLDNVSISGINTTGMVAGYNSGTIEYVAAEGTIGTSSNGGYEIGGLVGRNAEGGTIRHSRAVGAINGQDAVGGLIGICSHCTLLDSYAIVDVAASQVAAGGLIGTVINFASLTRLYAAGVVSGDSTVSGAILGTVSINENLQPPSIFYDGLYFDQETTGQTQGFSEPDLLDATPLLTSEFANPDSFANWSFHPSPNATWRMGTLLGTARPRLDWEYLD